MSVTVTVNKTAQRFSSGQQDDPRIVLLHTTETSGWPGYGGGGSAPHSTIMPLPGKGIYVREHIPENQYAKALENRSGGVETNTSGVLQYELIGTCDEGRKGQLYYWPEADDAVMEALAAYLKPIIKRHDIPATCDVSFKSYNRGRNPSSYGLDNGVRMSWSKWRSYKGFCGHQHAPENNHGDPGDFKIDKLLKFLGGSTSGTSTTTTTEPVSTGGSDDDYYEPYGTSLTVEQIQRIVDVKADGYYGDDTEAAVARYQRDLGVEADGFWGPSTQKAHDSKKTATKRAPAFPLPKGHWYGVGSSDPRNHSGYWAKDRDGIRRWQTQMLDRGWTGIGALDGMFGEKSETVCKQFQREKGLKVDGAVGSVTWKASWTAPRT